MPSAEFFRQKKNDPKRLAWIAQQKEEELRKLRKTLRVVEKSLSEEKQEVKALDPEEDDTRESLYSSKYEIHSILRLIKEELIFRMNTYLLIKKNSYKFFSDNSFYKELVNLTRMYLLDIDKSISSKEVHSYIQSNILLYEYLIHSEVVISLDKECYILDPIYYDHWLWINILHKSKEPIKYISPKIDNCYPVIEIKHRYWFIANSNSIKDMIESNVGSKFVSTTYRNKLSNEILLEDSSLEGNIGIKTSKLSNLVYNFAFNEDNVRRNKVVLSPKLIISKEKEVNE